MTKNKKKKLIYFDCLRYSNKSINMMKKKFDVLMFKTPLSIRNKTFKDIELITAPLGYSCDSKFINKFPNLKIIISNTTSIPHIDEKTCKKNNIFISALHNDKKFLNKITPTAEHTVGLILASLRNIIGAHNSVLSGKWDRKDWGSPKMLSRMSVGIVGLGRIGSRVKKILETMGSKVFFYDPNKKNSEKNILELAKKSEILSINASYNKTSHRIINKNVLSRLPNNSIVVNTARGELLDTDALIYFLKKRKIMAAALDTIEGEYLLNFQSKLKKNKLYCYAKKNNNLILTPHIAGSTLDAWSETELRVINKAISYLY